MVQKHVKKPNGIWNELWKEFGIILAPFWVPVGAQERPKAVKKGVQEGTQKTVKKTALLIIVL